MKQAIRTMVLVLVLVAMVGCTTRQVLTTAGIGAAVAGTAAAVYYVKGDLEYDTDHPVARVHRASLDVAERRGYRVTDDEIGTSNSRIKARIPEQMGEKARDLTIKLKGTGQNVTHISIRVDILGDEALSRAILEDIQAELK